MDQRPESVDDQPVPKSLVRLMKSAEQAKIDGKRRQRKGKRCESSPDTATALERSVFVPGGGMTATPGGRGEASCNGSEEPMFQRQKGETLKAYFERIDIEANARIMESFRKSRKMSDRRQRYGQSTQCC